MFSKYSTTKLCSFLKVFLIIIAESRFLPLFEMKRFESRPVPGLGPGGLPPLTQVPIAGERCSARLESALDQLKSRKRNQPKNLDTPLVSYTYVIFL